MIELSRTNYSTEGGRELRPPEVGPDSLFTASMTAAARAARASAVLANTH
jgi:hypothetical protein